MGAHTWLQAVLVVHNKGLTLSLARALSLSASLSLSLSLSLTHTHTHSHTSKASWDDMVAILVSIGNART